MCNAGVPEEGLPVRGVIQFAHGMTETARRYSRFAEALTDAATGSTATTTRAWPGPRTGPRPRICRRGTALHGGPHMATADRDHSV